MQETYNIKLPLFEGPMDLLLHLIREQKIDIYDIPIAHITRQYLEYVEMMKELNLDIAGEFLVMAATLIHIKSRMLLPLEDTADTEEPEDPRMELVMKLLEYQAFKEAALGLKEREEEWTNVYSRSPMDDEVEEDDDQPVLFDLNLIDLLSTFQNILEQAPEEVRTLTKETLTIKDKMNMIIEVLQSSEAMRFEDLFKGDIIRSHFIVTFIAFLELIRLGLARVYQEKEFGRIWVVSPESTKDFASGYRPPLIEGVHSDEELWHPFGTDIEERHIPAASGIKLPQRPSFPSLRSNSSFSLPCAHDKVNLWKAPVLSPSPLYCVNREPQYNAAESGTTSRKPQSVPERPLSEPLNETVPDITELLSDYAELWRYTPKTGLFITHGPMNVMPFKVTFTSGLGTSVAKSLPFKKTALPSRPKPF